MMWDVKSGSGDCLSPGNGFPHQPPPSNIIAQGGLEGWWTQAEKTVELEESESQMRWDLRENFGPEARCIWKRGRSPGAWKVCLGFFSLSINRRKEKSCYMA